MESWGYVSQEKGFICDEINSPTNSLIRDKCSLLAWESTINNVEFPEMIVKELPDSISDVLRSKKVVTTYGISFDPILSYHPGEDESTSKLSCSVVDSSNGQDSLSLIDLKLGQFGDHHKDPQILSSESSTPPKKVRSLGVYSKMAFCQVYGCNKDLSSSKDYHKRHKVCEVHSKTAKVMVKGIEQRFCQQCSRFHLLAEFDDGKRSCRKRLAGHNERRRKPHVIHSRRTGRLLHSSNGGIFQGTTSSKSSFICQDLLPSAIWNDDCYRHIKVEDNNNNYKHLYEIPITNGTKPLTFPYNMESQFSPFHYNGVSSASTENMFHHINASSNFQVLHAIPDSIRALSLLSSQSQNSSNHSMACQYNNMAQVPEQKLMEEVVESSQEDLSGGGMFNNNNSNNNNNQFVSTAEGGADIGNSDDGVINIQQRADGILDLENDVKDRVSYENSQTIDLLQLSSQLPRVEHHRQSVLVKEENPAFCFVQIT